MTDIRLHVPDLETCEMLRDAGFPQDTILCWTRDGFTSMNPHLDNGYFIAAPIISEILNGIRNYIGVFFDDEEDMFACAWDRTDEDEYDGIIDDSNREEYFKYILNPNPATACALMWLRLRKEGKL